MNKPRTIPTVRACGAQVPSLPPRAESQHTPAALLPDQAGVSAFVTIQQWQTAKYTTRANDRSRPATWPRFSARIRDGARIWISPQGFGTEQGLPKNSFSHQNPILAPPSIRAVIPSRPPYRFLGSRQGFGTEQGFGSPRKDSGRSKDYQRTLSLIRTQSVLRPQSVR
jgi:hypothetical protein